jgi:hypothetical protein
MNVAKPTRRSIIDAIFRRKTKTIQKDKIRNVSHGELKFIPEELKKEEEDLYMSMRESRSIQVDIEKIAHGSNKKQSGGLFRRTSSLRSVSSDRHKLKSGKKLKGFEPNKAKRNSITRGGGTMNSMQVERPSGGFFSKKPKPEPILLKYNRIVQNLC